MPETARHLWVTRPQPGDDTGQGSALALSPAVDAHRRLRGPFTAAGTLMRHLVPGALASCPGLVGAHELEILTVAPELRGVMPSTHDTLTSLAVPKERTRFYSRNRTARLSHGLAEFIRDAAAQAGGGRRFLVIENALEADPTDQEFLEILLRRLDPGLVTLVIGAPADGTGPESLMSALRRYAVRPQGTAEPAQGAAASSEATTPGLAAAYVASHCLAGSPAQRAAYQELGEDERRRLHDERADALEAAGEASLRLGAIPFHRERGGDPAGRGAAALAEALDYCIDMGFYAATVDLGERGRAVVDFSTDPGRYWTFTTKMTTSLAALGRPGEAMALYDEVRALSTRPLVHMQAAYATAMIYTRHNEDEQRDHDAAIRWINQAIAISTTMEDPSERAFNTVFNENGKALIEAHRGRPQEALRLVTEGLDRLDRELGPGEHLLHRSVLLHNRAQVLTGLGRLAEALADFDTIIERDPNYDEYYFDRAGLLRRVGRTAEALADYDAAIRLSPPFPEFHYNRADLRVEAGDAAGALADFSRVLELSPDHTDARINRAALLAEAGETAAARADIELGLTTSPGDPHLLCLLGQVELADDRPDAARRAFDLAVAAAPELPMTWTASAEAALADGDLERALADLDHSLGLAADPGAYFNRGMIREAREEWDQALADFTQALTLAPEDTDIREHLAECQAHLV